MKFAKGDIYLVDLFGQGHEQQGCRPVIIYSEKNSNIVSIIPLTTNKSALKYHFTYNVKSSKENKLNEDSIALVFQLRIIDYRKIKNKLGNLEEIHLNEIDKQIKDMLKIK
ncbi:MAG: type II toxin-antitoxin system PemK/MazF family toxin [Nanoarchaeota archaeon]